MSLRLRLIVAFFLLSVVPLGAVTFFSYATNAQALREAAGRETELLAGELSQRMQVVTTQLSERVGYLMDVAEARAEATAAADAAASRQAKAVTTVAVPAQAVSVPSIEQAQSAHVAQALGEMAMLLDNIELRGMRGPRPPGGGRDGFPPPGANGGRGRRGENSSNPSAPDGVPQFGRRGEGTRGFPAPADRPRDARSGETDSASAATDAATSGRGVPSPAIPPPPPTSRPPAAPDRPIPPGVQTNPNPNPNPNVNPDPNPKDRIMIDVGPMRREIVRQFVPEGQWEQISQEERQRIMAEVNQRMLGIAQGIQMGAAEAQKRVAEAQRAADEKAQAAAIAAKSAAVKSIVAPAAKPAPAPKPTAPVPATPAVAATAPTPPVPPSPPRRKTAMTGSRLAVMVERDGKVVNAANAEVNLPNLLATIFATTRRDRGEVPFAIGKDGHLYTPTEEDRKKIEAIGGDVIKPDTPPGTTRLQDWVVVSTADPTGSGLKFGIARPVGDSLQALRRTSARNAGFGLAFIGLALIGIVPISSRLTKNLSTLSDGVRRIAQGDYRTRVKVGSPNDEVGRLAAAFNQMAEDVEVHQQAAVEQERIRRELELGRQIQHDMLPREPLRLGLTEIKGVSVPAREVGGDFFNYFSLPDGRIALLVGDVSGKGVGAALLMANIQASLRTRLALGQDLAAIAKELDVDIDGNTPGPIYATLFVGMLDPVSRQLRYVNAGHNPQYVLRVGGQLERMTSSGLPVGLLSGRGYAEACVQLGAGDRLFFYTDGCVEAEDDSGEMFGDDRLEHLLVSGSDGDDLLARVETVIKTYRGKREPFDDATMMVVKVG